MTTTILNPQVLQPICKASQSIRRIRLSAPSNVSNPKFGIGDRAIAFNTEDLEDLDIQAGVISGIALKSGVWSYQVTPGRDKELLELCTCSNPEDYPWFEESKVQLLTDSMRLKAKRLIRKHLATLTH